MPRELKTFIDFEADLMLDPAILPLSDKSCVLWMRSIFWSSRNRTNLWVPRSALTELGGRKRNADALIAAGLWLADDGGYWLVRNELWRVRREYREKVPEWLRAAVLSRDGNACVECGTGDDLQMDHIFPWSRGGETTFENLQSLCGPCNRRKGARV